MKKIINRFKRLGTQIMFMLILFCSVPLIIVGVNSYRIARIVLYNKLEITSSQTITEINRGISNYFAGMTNQLKVIANDSDAKSLMNEDSVSEIENLMENVNSTDDNIINVYIATTEGDLYLNPVSELPEDFDPRKSDWYTKATSNVNDLMLSDPYIDTATGNTVATISKAILNNGTLVGVAGIDISLSGLANTLSDIKIGNSGYTYIVDKNGILISHPDQELIGTDTVQSLSYWQEAKNNDSGFVSYDYNGEPLFASFTTNELTGWKVIAAMKYSELTLDTSTIIQSLFIVIVISIVVALLISILFSRPISKSIHQLRDAFHHLSDGDLTRRVSIRSSNEFSLIGEDFNTMADNITILVRDVKSASSHVLDTSITLSSMSEETSASVSEVTKASEEVAKGASEQAQNSYDAVSSTTLLSEELDSIQSSTTYLNQLSEHTSNLTKQGLNRIQLLADKSEITMESTAHVSQLVNETYESMGKIDAISDVIDSIAEQTNLLSLNASIEAARAGESGKGFAVVANEIRQLAEQSKASTIKIKGVINEIGNKTNRSVDAMKSTNQNVSEQVTLVLETKAVFQEIMDAVQILLNNLETINKSIDAIGTKKDDILNQIESISAISQESASASEEVTASTEQINITMDEINGQAAELQALSESLQEKLNQFRIS
ncbi:MAG: methyl-accepting chemotaxis protein [Herbinix sp.]|jgi:methyl-accepting chemotaxis protein|nr:methyl-accepting chemotaxis protein [Herbinix sp.]